MGKSGKRSEKGCPSSLGESEKGEYSRSICFGALCGASSVPLSTLWFSVDVSGGNDDCREGHHDFLGGSHRLYHEGKDLQVLGPIFRSRPWERSVAVVGHTVYKICVQEGHSGNPSRRVQCLDLGARPSQRECKSMEALRCGPEVVSLDGKVYVFSHVVPPSEWDSDDDEAVAASKEYGPWAEVFEPSGSGGQWKTFSDSPPAPYRSDIPRGYGSKIYVVASESSSRSSPSLPPKIFVFRPPAKLVYASVDLDVAKWKTLAENEIFGSIIQGRPLVFDNNVFWLHRGLHAYNFDDDVYFSGTIHDSEIMRLLDLGEDLLDSVRLFHLKDDIFCLLWVDSAYNDHDHGFTYHFHFTKLRFTMSVPCFYDIGGGGTHKSRRGSINASVISCSCYVRPDFRSLAEADMVLNYGVVGNIQELGKIKPIDMEEKDTRLGKRHRGREEEKQS